MKKHSRILITGARGLVGRNLAEYLEANGYTNVFCHNSEICDLTSFDKTMAFFQEQKPEYVFHSAAAVYGIMGNMTHKGESILKNILINTHVVEACRLVGVKKILAMGTGCVYPYPSPALPLKEDMVWSGAPHPAEDSYAHAKRAMLAQLIAYKENYNMDFTYVISGNLYGFYDKFDPEYGHVIPSLIRKFYEAVRDKTTVSIWGNGTAQRDFIYAKDVARALEAIMLHCTGAVNMGSNQVHAIRDIVNILAEHTSMSDKLVWDETKPNGQDYRAYDLNHLFNAGFKPEYSLATGLIETYEWYKKNAESARK